jgi:hypothetical protein
MGQGPSSGVVFDVDSIVAPAGGTEVGVASV